MDADEGAKILVQSAREEIRRTIGDAMVLFRTGKPRQFLNPFSGRMASLTVDPALAVVSDKLGSSGLRDDGEFLAALEKALTGLVSSPVFRLFSAFDGEGAFVRDATLEVRVVDGAALPGHLHEILYPIHEDLIASSEEGEAL